MATQNQIDQSRLAAFEARERANAAAQGVQAGGSPVQSAQEAADAESITNFQRPALGDVIGEMVQPRNLIPTIAQGVATTYGGPTAGMTATRAVQPVSTALQRFSEGKPMLGEGYVGDLAWNAGINEFGNKVLGPALGKAASWLGQSSPAQYVRQGLARAVIGKVTPTARAAYEFGGEMVDDALKAVNAVRGGQGKPLYTREAVEEAIAPHLEQLQRRGVFTVPQLTSGGKTDALEPLASGSFAGKGTFASKAEGQDALMEAWPKIFAGLLGEEGGGPDQIAALAAMSIEGSLRLKEKAAGGIMQGVEGVVGKNVIDIGPELLTPLERELSLFTKRTMDADGAGKVGLDAEGMDPTLKAAIGLVERATGKSFSLQTGEFVEKLDPALAGQPQAVIDAMRAQGVLPQTRPINFTFTDIKTLKGHLNELAARIPEGQKRQANATLSKLSSILDSKMGDTLAAEDAARGFQIGHPDSLSARYAAGKRGYEASQKLRDGFQAQGWIEQLQRSGKGADVLKEVWPDDADILRVGNLKELMGGDKSPYWETMKRFKVEQMLGDKTKNPKDFVEFLTDYKTHSKEYWDATLGKDQYDRVLKFAQTLAFSKRKNPFSGEAGLARRVDAGFLLAAVFSPVAHALAPVATLGTGAAGAGWIASTRQVAKWLTNPNDSAMFQSVLSGKPVTLKAKTWFRNQVARATAEATMDSEPDLRPVPLTTTRQNYNAATGRAPQPATGYGGTRG